VKTASPRRMAYCKAPSDCVAPKFGPCARCQPHVSGKARSARARHWAKARGWTNETVPSWIDPDFDDTAGG